MSDVQISVSQDLVKPVIEAKIKAAILQALKGDDSDVISEIVGKIINMRVNEKGTISNYDSENKYSLVEQMMQCSIRECAREALKQMVEESKPKIIKELHSQLKKSGNKVVKAFVSGMFDCMKSDWQFGVKVNFQTIKDDDSDD